MNIGELNNSNGLTALGVTGSDTLAARVIAAAIALDFAQTSHGTAKASDLFEQLIPGRDGDTINVTYADADPAITIPRSAKVDMAAPVVTLVSPTDKFYTSERTVTLSAEVTDAGAGVNQSELTVYTLHGHRLGIHGGCANCGRLQGDKHPLRRDFRGNQGVGLEGGGQGGQYAKA